ncbi:MAG: MFS transporter [Acidothermaceae bacterium]
MPRLCGGETQLSTKTTKADVDISSTSALLVRDRVTWLIYLQLATYGFFLYAFTPSVTLLRDDEHVSRAISGLHGTGLAVGAVAAGAVLSRLVARFGRARLMRAGTVILCLGIVIFISCTIVAVTITGAVVAGFGGTIVVNLSAAMLTTQHPGPAGGTAVTEANGVGSGLGIVAPLLISAAIAIHLGWRAGVLVTIVLAIAVRIAFRRDVIPDDRHRSRPHRAATSKRMSSEFWRATGVLVMTTAIEFSMTIWSSDVLQNHDGLSKGTAATGVTAIVAGMTLGRLASKRFTLRYAADTLLLWAFAITFVGFAAFWISSIVWLGFVGLFVIGLGISLQFPLAITRAIGFSDNRPDVATGYAALGTGFAIGVAPFALGAFADHTGSHTAMLVVPVFVVLGAIGVATTKRKPAPLSDTVRPLAIGDVPATAD